MLRSIIRTSRCLVRRQINKFNPVVLNKIVDTKSLKYSEFKTYREYSSGPISTEQIDPIVFDEICNETLESLCDYFEELVEEDPNLKGADILFSDGVLTVALGSKHGTYVINRQTPNKQIWLSSPTSGPKRYDLVLDNGGYWIYKHNNESLHKLLQNELSKIINTKIDFSKCAHSLV